MWRCSSVGQSMRLISAESGVRIPAPPPFFPSLLMANLPQIPSFYSKLKSLGLMVVFERVMRRFEEEYKGILFNLET